MTGKRPFMLRDCSKCAHLDVCKYASNVDTLKETLKSLKCDTTEVPFTVTIRCPNFMCKLVCLK